METLLFKDSETFIKERPTKLSEKQEAEIWQKLAKEVIDNGWSDDDIDTIIEDLQNLSMYYSGYEMAKDLEGFSSNGNYDIDTSFTKILNDAVSLLKVHITYRGFAKCRIRIIQTCN